MAKKRSGFDMLVNWFSPRSVLADPVFTLRMSSRQAIKRAIKTIGQEEYDRLAAQVTQKDIDAVLRNSNRKLPKDLPDLPSSNSLMDEIEITLAAIWEDAIQKVVIIVCNIVGFYIMFKVIAFLLSA